MIYEENTDKINVFPILHRHIPPRFNAFLPTEQHQSLATAELIVDTDTICSRLQWWIARRFGSLSSLHFISVTDVGSSPPPFCRPPPGMTGQQITSSWVRTCATQPEQSTWFGGQSWHWRVTCCRRASSWRSWAIHYHLAYSELTSLVTSNLIRPASSAHVSLRSFIHVISNFQQN